MRCRRATPPTTDSNFHVYKGQRYVKCHAGWNKDYLNDHIIQIVNTALSIRVEKFEPNRIHHSFMRFMICVSRKIPGQVALRKHGF